MAQTYDYSPHLTCQVNIISLINFDLDLPGNLYVRYYVVAGGGKRIRIDTREIRSTGELCWNELSSLEFLGASDLIRELLDSFSVHFELRWRRTTPLLGRIAGSKLLGRGELAWKDALASTHVPLEKWISFTATDHWFVDSKPPALLVKMKIEVLEPTEKRKTCRAMRWKACDCRDCEWNASGEDMFVGA